jgi:hypothetical protein
MYCVVLEALLKFLGELQYSVMLSNLSFVSFLCAINLLLTSDSHNYFIFFVSIFSLILNINFTLKGDKLMNFGHQKYANKILVQK